MASQNMVSRKWKQLAIGMFLIGILLLVIVTCGFYTARLTLSDHRNLYYTLWKAGFRDYDWTVTKGGLLHDQEFREALRGLTVEEFEQRFPNTFYEMKSLPPNAVEGRTYYTDNYFSSRSGGHQYGFGWVVVFGNGRLLEFGYEKDI